MFVGVMVNSLRDKARLAFVRPDVACCSKTIFIVHFFCVRCIVSTDTVGARFH